MRVVLPEQPMEDEYKTKAQLIEELEQIRQDNAELRAAQEVIKQQKAEDALRSSEARYARATRAGLVGVWDWNLETNAMYIDPFLKELIGFADNEIRNHLDDWGTHVHPDDTEKVIAAAQAHISGKAPQYEVEHRMIHKDGSTRWFLARGQIIHDDDGEPTRMVGTDTDITLLKHVEETLQQREAQLRQIIDLVPHMIFAKNETGRFVLVNQATADAYGTTVEKLLGICQSDVHSQEEELQRMLGDDREVIRSGMSKLIPEETFVGASGKRSVLQTIKIPYTAAGDERKAVLGVAVDITKRKQAEEALQQARKELKLRVQQRTAELASANVALQESEKRYRTVSELVSDYVYALRVLSDGTLVPEWVTDSFPAVTGFTLDEVTENNGWESLIHPDDRARVRQRMQKLLSGQADVCELRIKTKDGTIRRVRDYTRPEWDDQQGRVTRLYGAAQDITESKASEA